MNNSVEILAPGGSLACLKAAIDSGADAVYFAGSRFGARSNAVNLSNDEIIEAVEYAHLRLAKVYVTVNTLVFDSELDDVFEFLKFCYTEKVDAVIVQDLGVLNMIKTYFPDMRVHASTQLTVHNLAGALQAKKMGFDRVVLSRELSLDEIRYIANNADIELEVFVHGALCMSYSGQCLFSSFLGGRSGNRGSCAQPCRLAYTLLDADGNQVSQKDKYLLSLKDLCLVDRIDTLRQSGVTSLKIEGRMKSEAYVSAVSGIYNKYRSGGEVAQSDISLLKNIFSRSGFTAGYYNAQYGRDMLSYSSNHNNIFDSATDSVINQAKSYACVKRSINIDAHFKMKLGEKPVFTVSYNGIAFTAYGENEAQRASNAPINTERIQQQLLKLGGTVFEYSSLVVDVEEGLYISVKDINNLRREVLFMLQNYILGGKRQYTGQTFRLIRPQIHKNEPLFTASVLTADQASKAYDLGFQRIYIPYDVYSDNPSLYDNDADIYVVKLPPVVHDSRPVDYSVIKTDSVSVANIGQISNISSNVSVCADYRMNIYNSLAIKQLVRMGISYCTLSPELTLNQIKNTAKSIPAEVLVYGRVSMMTVRNCLIKSATGRCFCKKGDIYYLKDRKNICFPVIPDKNSCTNVIYNSAPIVMSDRMHELEDTGASMYRFDFTLETPDEMEAVMKMYQNSKKPDSFFTRGHFYKGVL